MNEIILNYKNKKTNSEINFFATNVEDIETFNYLCKVANYNDNRILKSNITKLSKCLSCLVQKRLD